MHRSPTALGHGFALKHSLFDPNCYYAGCAICGKVYQSTLMRSCGKVGHSSPLFTLITAQLERWKVDHAKGHSEREHMMLRLSGRSCTAEAAHKLAAYGVIPLIDMVMDEEVASALAEAPAEIKE